MRTVKEISDYTGVSVRTLHYYDEIDLLKPTDLSDGGYRLYDDKALETLQQILFFREFDIPLKEIKMILANPDFDKKEILTSQKQMIELKRQRLERLLAAIDDILKGEDQMSFEIFKEEEINTMYSVILDNLKHNQKKSLMKQYGSMEKYKESFIQSAGDHKSQKNFEKMKEWYGDSEDATIFRSYQKRRDAIYQRLAKLRGTDVTTFDVKQVVGEMDFVVKQQYQIEDAAALMNDIAEEFLGDEAVKKEYDGRYGDGTSEYIGSAIKEFYQK